MRGDWHRLAEMAAKRHLPRAAMLAAGHHPLPLVDNIKNNSIDNTRYLMRNSLVLLKYIRSGLSTIFEALVAVLESWHSAS